MKKQLQNEIWLFRLVDALPLALSGQPTPEVIVALDSAVTAGVARLLVPFPLNR